MARASRRRSVTRRQRFRRGLNDVMVFHADRTRTLAPAASDTDTARGDAIQDAGEAQIQDDHLVFGPGTFEIAQDGGTAGVGIRLPVEVTGLRFSGCGIGISTITTAVANQELLHMDCEGGYASDFTLRCTGSTREPMLFANAAANLVERLDIGPGGSATPDVAVWTNGTTSVATLRDCIIGGIINAQSHGALTMENCTVTYAGTALTTTASLIDTGTVVCSILCTDCTFDISGVDEACAVLLISQTAVGSVAEFRDCTITGSPNAAGDGLVAAGSLGSSTTTIRVRGGTITAGRYALNQSGTKTIIEKDSAAVTSPANNGTITAI